MKNKKLTYILLPVVIILWAYIFYRIYVGLKPNDLTENITINQLDTSFYVKNERKYELSYNYADPFQIQNSGKEINNRASTDETASDNNRFSNFNRRRNLSRVRWPQLTYKGLIYNKKSKVNTGLLIMNGQNHLIHENEVLNEIVIQQIYEDSLVVQFKKQLKTLDKQ